MSLLFSVSEVVAPVFILAAIGFLWVKLGFEYRVQFVTRLSMSLGVPCLIFTALMQTKIDAGFLQITVFASILAYALVTLVGFALVKLAGLDLRTYLGPLIFGNTGNVGLPLAFFAFGDEGFGYAVVIFAIMGMYSFTAGIWIVSGGGSRLKIVKEPLVSATFLGALFLWQGWQTPPFLTNTLELIGQMAIPLMLITRGVAVARLTPGRVSKVAWLALIKYAGCLICACAAGWWFNLPDIAFAVLVLQVTTPVAVTSYMLAEKYGADAQAVAGLVVISTLFSVALIPITLAVLIA